MVSTITGFISSEGCKVMKPRFSQRWAPPPINPSASTRIRSRRTTT
jgi:hypothetical protein